MGRFLISTVFLAILVLSCGDKRKKSSEKYAVLHRAAWLVGTWENKNDQGNLEESWERINDSTYAGTSYFIKEKDTLHSESIVLGQRNGVITYSPTVQGQNDGKPVIFRQTSAQEKTLMFENPTHDFPKKIVYNRVSTDSLVAVISGTQQGKASSDSFSMKKTK